FDLTILDDGVLDGTQIATVTAMVPGVGNGSGSMAIYDKETAGLQLTLPPSVGEGQNVQGTVQVSAVPAANVSVLLSSSDTNELTVPATVMIPAGQTSAVFTASAMVDNELEAPQAVTVTAHVQNWTNGTATIYVTNNKNWTLALKLPASAWENAGVLTNAGLVTLSGTLASPFAVSLTSSNPTKIMVPATVTIPAGQLSKTFDVTPVDDSLVEGHQTVVITASAPGFTNGSASIFI